MALVRQAFRIVATTCAVACAALLIVITNGCAPRTASPDKSGGAPQRRADEETQVSLRAAIDRSVSYLIKACDEEGKFTYLIDLNDSAQPDQPSYNVVRHAGAIYALAQYCQQADDPDARSAMLRAAEFLRRRTVAPAADNPNFLAIWSDPQLVGPDQPRQAKLGGTGLGLVALLSVEQVVPDSVPQEELIKLGRFLIYMQKPDGSFYAKYYPDRGRDDTWESMYYPGEAALGLLMLYDHHGAQQWKHTATKAMENLARRGAQQDPTLPDQWYLLAFERWLASEGNGATGELLLTHARHLCRDMLQEQKRQLQVPQLAGCFTPEGRTCPTATRLEGLLAALRFLPARDEALRSQIRDSVESGMQFLLASQVTTGPYAGALPRYRPGFEPHGVSENEMLRLQEVRIDYVQHALSAMLAYAQRQ